MPIPLDSKHSCLRVEGWGRVFFPDIGKTEDGSKNRHVTFDSGSVHRRVFRIQFDPDERTTQPTRHDAGGSGSRERIEHDARRDISPT